MHISGLEFEGRHPRALMECALLLLRQVIGLEDPTPDQVRKKPVYCFAITESLAISGSLVWFWYEPSSSDLWECGNRAAISKGSGKRFWLSTPRHFHRTWSKQPVGTAHL